jgi:ABC-type transport system substrate-binding protein
MIPFNDLLVRQAFRHAINPAAALRSLFFGVYEPVGGPLSPDTPFYDASFEHAYPYDIAAADKLLDQAGWTGRDSAGYRTKDAIIVKSGRRRSERGGRRRVSERPNLATPIGFRDRSLTAG